MKKTFNYPKRYDEHMITVPEKHRPPVLDETYPYRDLSFKGKFNRFFTYFILRVMAFPLIRLFCGLKIKGRETLKKHKELLKNGAITICNHVHMWDMVCVMKAIRPVSNYHPGWSVNMKGPNASLIRGIGGMPVPQGMKGLKKFSDTMDEIIEEGTWIHFYPEASMWFYYNAVRPFKKGAFALAVKHNKPILPLVITYRPAKGIRRIFGHPQFLTITIGEPLLPDLTKERNEATLDLLERSRSSMQNMSGFEKLIPQNEIERKGF